MRALLRALTLALVCFSASIGTAHAATEYPGMDAEERKFCRMLNTYRVNAGLQPVRVSFALTNAAQWLSTDMAKKDYFDHTDSLDRDFSVRIAAFGYRGLTKGENIAAGADGSAPEMLRMWKASPEHKVNMLRARFKVVGVGRAFNLMSTFGWYWATDFGAVVDRSVPC